MPWRRRLRSGCSALPLIRFTPEPPPTDVTYANGRLTDRTYASRTFILNFPRQSPDYGEPSRYVWKVFDEPSEDDSREVLAEITVEEHVLSTTPGGRKQIKLQITRSAGNVRKIEIQRVPTDPTATEMHTVLTLDREASARLMLLARSLEYIPVEGDEETIRVDDSLLQEIFTDPEAMELLYRREAHRFRRFVEDDPTANDILALAHRREVVEHFRRLLTEPDFFEAERIAGDGRRESVWQRFLEKNVWILGIGLTGQLLTSWDNDKLEKTVAGFSVTGPGKRTDALLRTTGSIRSLVFAEIKHHLTDLLAPSSYRPGCWPPSTELAGGITQVQQTVQLAIREIGERLRDRDTDGAETGEFSFLLRPRSFLILGNLNQLRGEAGGVHPEKFSSFELCRRNLYEPEVLTFDELLARAEWHVTLAEEAQAEV